MSVGTRWSVPSALYGLLGLLLGAGAGLVPSCRTESCPDVAPPLLRTYPILDAVDNAFVPRDVNPLIGGTVTVTRHTYRTDHLVDQAHQYRISYQEDGHHVDVDYSGP